GKYSMIVGMGGGSCLDLTKLASVFTNNEGDIADYLNLTSVRKIKNKGVFTILIPTTSGTGSEVTDITVLALDQTKDVISHEYLKANLAIIDPKLTITVPPQVTAATGADAFTHAIEAYLSINANPVSDGLALQAIRLIGGSLSRAVKNGTDKDARIAMSYGSYIAGLAFHNAGVGAVHALAYPLGGQFHMAHGDSNAVMLPYVLGFISRSCQSRLKDILSVLEESSYDMPDELAARRCISKLAVLMKEIGIPDTLKSFNIPESAIQSLAHDAVQQKRLLSRCPVELDEDSIYTIYDAAFKGKITYGSN
ncbi:MAG TPA: iron-containing alcohol dehydrogenase, partial [Membranihabitans sp.]|nr:iron-containing alcohol dehydrogenase [Membranihabitans sp.]